MRWHRWDHFVQKINDLQYFLIGCWSQNPLKIWQQPLKIHENSSYIHQQSSHGKGNLWVREGEPVMADGLV